jgi:hypothetical protein
MPQTSPEEQMCLCFVSIVNAMMYVYLIGSITSMLESKDQPVKNFRMNMDNLNQYFKDAGIDHPLRVRARNYLRASKHVSSDAEYVGI